jgi:hypothetical protein
MSRGIVLIANNNESIDYIMQACFSAKNIKKYIGLPVTLITDTPTLIKTKYKKYAELFDNVIEHVPNVLPTTKTYRDGAFNSKTLKFKNLSRASVFDLTPYDETIVLDTDVLIFNNNFLKCFDQKHDLLVYRNAVDVCDSRSDNEFILVSDASIDFYWATCIFFRKTPENKIFFELVSHIQENWNHYRLLYQITIAVFRNDFAFSIAIHIMNGKSNGGFATELPGTMSYILDKDILLDIDNNKMKFLVEKQYYFGEYTLAKTTGIDVHVMNKFSLARFIEGGTGV